LKRKFFCGNGALRLSGGPFAASGGSLVARLNGKSTSLEYGIENFGSLRGFYKNVNFGRDWTCVIALPWISGFDGLLVAWVVAAAYALATSGAVFDPQEGKVLSPAEALKVIKGIERTRPEAEAALRNAAERVLGQH
jgi:hypothetical protein